MGRPPGRPKKELKILGDKETDAPRPPGFLPKENPLEGLVNLETGEAPEPQPRSYPSLKAAAFALKIDASVLKEARGKACPAFEGSGAVHRQKLLDWLDANNLQHAINAFPHTQVNASKLQQGPSPKGDTPPVDEPEEEDNYDPDETGGVGQTLQSLQAYERKLKRRVDQIEKQTDLHPATKAERLEKAQAAWLKVVGPLLKYDLSVSLAKRQSGELIPLADAVKAVNALLAWHTVAISDALRNVIPNCELKSKYEIAALLDPALRSSIYRNFKLGVKLGKIPEWMGKSASEFIASEPQLSIDPPKGETLKSETNLNEY